MDGERLGRAVELAARLHGDQKRKGTEVEFREWYVSLLDRVNLSNPAGYELAMRVLNCPQEVSGYREIRYPKMDAAKATVETDLGSNDTPAAPKVEVAVQRNVLTSLRTPAGV